MSVRTLFGAMVVWCGVMSTPASAADVTVKVMVDERTSGAPPYDATDKFRLLVLLTGKNAAAPKVTNIKSFEVEVIPDAPGDQYTPRPYLFTEHQLIWSRFQSQENLTFDADPDGNVYPVEVFALDARVPDGLVPVQLYDADLEAYGPLVKPGKPGSWQGAWLQEHYLRKKSSNSSNFKISMKFNGPLANEIDVVLVDFGDTSVWDDTAAPPVFVGPTPDPVVIDLVKKATRQQYRAYPRGIQIADQASAGVTVFVRAFDENGVLLGEASAPATSEYGELNTGNFKLTIP